MANRVVPAAQCALFDPGAEGWAIENGYDLYDIPSERVSRAESLFGQKLKEWEYDVSYRALDNDGAYYEPSITAMSEINAVVPRMRVVYQDTPTSRYTFFGGVWENIAPLDPPRRDRLVQSSAAPNTVWRAQATWWTPEDPNLAFTVQRLAAQHTNDDSSYPAKVQIVIGDWTIRFSSGDDAGIWRRIAGRWQQVIQLSLSGLDKEVDVWVTVRRGCVCFSFDRGKKWEVAHDTVPLTIPEGTLVSFEGVSCKASFGHHQLTADVCYYETFDLPVLEEHMGSPLRDLSQVLLPAGTDVTLTFLSAAPLSVRYRITLTPKSFAWSNVDFDLCRVPEVYGVMVYWPTILAGSTGSSVDINTLGVLQDIEIQEEVSLNYRTGSITLDRDPTVALTGDYGFRLLDIDLGWAMDDGTFDLVDRGLFYVILPEPSSEGEWDARLQLQLIDTFYRATTTIVDEGWRPLDGMTALAARNYILLKMGLNPTARADWWDADIVLPDGLPDYPRWWPEPGMTAADLFAALDVFEDVETFVGADGTWTSLPTLYTSIDVDFALDGDPAADATLRVKKASLRAEHQSVRTAIFLTGQDLRGGKVYATAINYDAERDPTVPGFVGWRIWERHENVQVVTLEDAMRVALQRLTLLSTTPYSLEATVEGDPRLFRTQRISVANATNIGVGVTNEFRVDGLTSRWVAGQSNRTEQTIRGRRIVT